MSKNRVIYNQIGTFIGPCPSTGYHYLTTDGSPTNNDDLSTNFNLVFPLNRIIQANYGFTENRTDIKSLGYHGTIARPTISHDVNLSLSFYQMGLINERRLGFTMNFPSNNTSTGTPIYSSRVIPISGFFDRNYNTGTETTLGWPLTTTDSHNIFIATKQNYDDFNNTNSGQPGQSSVDVFAFGDCYLNSYRTQGAVKTIPTVSVDFTCNNIEFYNYGSGKNIPSVDTKTFTKIPNKIYSLPNNFQGTGLPTVLLPQDIVITINRYPEYLNRPIAYWTMDGNSNDSINSNSGTDVLVTYSALSGKINQGAVFGNTGKINIPYNSLFDLNNLTISAWVYSSGFSSINMMVFEKELVSESPYGLFFENGDIHFRTNNSNDIGNDLIVSTSSAGITNNNWHHIVGVYDGNYKRIYVNGSEKTNAIYNETLKTNTYQSTIGAISGGTYHFSGAIDEVGIWNHGLTSSDVSILYNNGNGLQPPFAFTPSVINNVPINFSDIKIQSYNIDLSLPREPLYNLGYKLPMDRRINLPVYANLDFNVIVGDSQTGSLIDLVKDDKEYNITLKLRYQSNSRQNDGTAVQYEFLGAKFNGMSLSESIAEKRTANFSFTSEINPVNLNKGFFISGQLGIPIGTPFGEVLLGDDFFGVGSRDILLTEGSDWVTISNPVNRPIY